MRTPTRKSSFPRIALRGKSLLVKHQSLAHDNLRRKASQMKAKEIEEAVQWCKDNNKRGWGGPHLATAALQSPALADAVVQNIPLC